MNKRYVLLCISSVVLIFLYYMYYGQLFSSSRVEVIYSEYNKEKDFFELDVLLEKYKFWLFHENYKKGECPLYSVFDSMQHNNDFDNLLVVPYYIKIARVKDKIVGFVSYYISGNMSEDNKDIKKIGRIHLLCIDESYRRFGIARNMISDVLRYFKEEKCDRAYLVTRPENIRAKELYYKFGFHEVQQNDLSSIFDTDPAHMLILDL
jgi:ribosomal protein S18 acetylase RimI-like enzyme